MLSDGKKIGAMLCFLGLAFFMFGVMWFLDRSLLTIGNVLFLTGVTLVIGPSSTAQFFATRSRKVGVHGVLCFFGGIILVLLKWTLFGIVLEAFGFLNLFGNFFPLVISFARRITVFNAILELPVIRDIADKIAGTQRPAQWA